MFEPDPDAELCATRQAVEKWLTEHAEYLDQDHLIAADSLALWAMSFLRLSEKDAQEAAACIKRQGIEEFAERVRRHAADIRAIIPSQDELQTLGFAFEAEFLRRRMQD